MTKMKSIITTILKKNVHLRKLVRKKGQAFKCAKYVRMVKNERIDDNLILFESYMGRQYACSPKALYEEMLKDPLFNKFKFVWFFKEPEKVSRDCELNRATIIKYGSSEYYRFYGRAKYVITNSNIKNQIQKKEGQVFIQTWHGTPLKRLRCDIEAQNGNAYNTLEEIQWKNDIDIRRYDGFISPSRFASEKFTSAFNLRNLGLEDIIIEEGYPRNDFLYNYTINDIIKIKRKLGIENTKKKVILYAPTFRDNQHDSGKGYVYDIHLDFERMRRVLEDEYIILFRPHYFIANSFDFTRFKGFVYNVADIEDINYLYIITDLLITDYSSVFFDFANLKKPMLFYMYDLDVYSEEIRGFYLSLDELPGKIVTTEDSLLEAIKEDHFVYDETYKKFNETYNYLDDGNASKRTLEQIFKLKKK